MEEHVVRRAIIAIAVAFSLLGIFGLVATSSGTALAGPPPPTTELVIVNQATNYVACASTGYLPIFDTQAPTGCQTLYEDFNVQSNGSYTIKPHGSSYCLTQSTTQAAVVKIEPCGGQLNEDWFDVLCNAPDQQYVWENAYNGNFVRNPGGQNGGTAVSTSIGGCSTTSELMRQVS